MILIVEILSMILVINNIENFYYSASTLVNESLKQCKYSAESHNSDVESY